MVITKRIMSEETIGSSVGTSVPLDNPNMDSIEKDAFYIAAGASGGVTPGGGVRDSMGYINKRNNIVSYDGGTINEAGVKIEHDISAPAVTTYTLTRGTFAQY